MLDLAMFFFLPLLELSLLFADTLIDLLFSVESLLLELELNSPLIAVFLICIVGKIEIQLDCRSATHTQKNNLPTNQKGYDTFETTVGKLSARKIQI